MAGDELPRLKNDDVTGFTAPITVSVDDVVTFELDGTASNT